MIGAIAFAVGNLLPRPHNEFLVRSPSVLFAELVAENAKPFLIFILKIKIIFLYSMKNTIMIYIIN